MIKAVDLTPPDYLRSELDDAYNRVMSSGRYIGGLEVEAFEKEFADYNHVPHCIGVANGFDALQLCLRALLGRYVTGYKPVFVPAFTAPPVWAAVIAVNADPINEHEYYKLGTPCDIVIAVNLYGERSPKIDHIRNRDQTFIIEDASQSHGLRPDPRADATTFSFYPTKNLGAYGDAGCICTHNGDLADRIRALHNYGTPGAINSRLDPLQAAFLRVKLPYLDEWNAIRVSQASDYTTLLQHLPLTLPTTSDEHVFHQYVIKSNCRDALREYLFAVGVETQIHYDPPPCDALNTPMTRQDTERARATASRVLSLPIGPHLSSNDIATVARRIETFYTP